MKPVFVWSDAWVLAAVAVGGGLKGCGLKDVIAAGELINRALLNSDEIRNALGKLVDDMDKAVEAKKYAQWAGLNTEFHLLIGVLPRLPMLREMTERVLARWGRIHRYYFRGVLVRRAEQAQQEHRAMFAAIRARDLAALEDRVRRHNRRALDSYMKYLDGQSGRSSADGR